jgi:hypothetical protein
MRGYDYDDRDYALDALKHSGLGIASFMLAIGAGVMMVILILVAVVIEASQPGAFDAQLPSAMVVGLGFCFAILLAVMGIGLGIAGVCQKHRKTVFAILGLVFNGLIIVGVGCLALIGIASNQAF